MSGSKLMYSTGTGMSSTEFVDEEESGDICVECGESTVVRFEIWERCMNLDCGYEERVECCHQCAGLE